MRTRRPFATLRVASCIAFFLAGACYAQFSGSIQGTVQDPSGAGVAKAQVHLLNVNTQVRSEATSGNAGDFSFVSLAPGAYRIAVEAPGFTRTAVEINLQTDQNLNVPVTLQVGVVSNSVEVSVAAPILNTAESRNQLTLATQELSNLPLAGRNMLNLITLAPGVTGLGTAGAAGNGSATDNYSPETHVTVSANGRSANGNLYVVDGLDVTSDVRPGVLNLVPNPDSIQETSIQTNTYTVEYGRASSIQVMMTTKSGTNAFHGNVSDYFTTQQLWAGTEFVHNYTPFHSNNVSATFGGPILKRHQMFFFVSVEPLRELVSTGNSTYTYEDPAFTAFALKNFPNSLGTKLLTSYPASAATFTAVSKTAANVFSTTCNTAATYLLPCNTPMIDTGSFNGVSYRNGTEYNARLDKYFGKDRIYANFYATVLNTDTANIRPAFTDGFHYTSYSGQVNETHAFSSNTVGEAAFGFLRIEGIAPQTGLFLVPVTAITGQSAGFGDASALEDYIQHNYHWRAAVTNIHGGHTWKFGLDGWHGDDVTDFAPVYAQPHFQFTNLLTLATDSPSTETNLAYNPLTGQPAAGNNAYTNTTFGLFVEDSWKVRKNLTLNYGLRWDDFGNPYPTNGTIFSNFYMGAGQTLPLQVSNGGLVVSNHFYNHTLTNRLSPRLGIAWDPSSKGTWVVRGGVGIFRDWPTLGAVIGKVASNPPGWISPTFYSGTANAPIFAEGTSNSYPFGFPYPVSTAGQLDAHGGLVGSQITIGGVDPNLKSPITYNYTATVEHHLAGNFVASVGYSGSHSHGMLTGSGQTSTITWGSDINRFAGDLVQNNNVLTGLNHSFGVIQYVQNIAEANYDAAIVAVRGKIGSRGFVNVSYWRSTSKDDSLVYPTSTNIHQYYGPSAWDTPNNFNLGWSYTLPGVGRGHSVAAILTQGWSVTGTTLLQSGLPFTVSTNAVFQPVKNSSGVITGMTAASGDYNADGKDLDYPNVTSYATPTGRQNYLQGLFTAASFGVPTMGTEGNELANRFRGPGFAETDAGLLKDTAITERIKLQLRFEFYNIFNRPNLTSVDANLPDASFGKVTSQYNPRWMQLGANLKF